MGTPDPSRSHRSRSRPLQSPSSLGIRALQLVERSTHPRPPRSNFFFTLPNFSSPSQIFFTLLFFSSPSSLPICYHVSRFSYHILTSRKNSSQIGSKSRKIRPFWVDRSPPLDRRSKCRPQAVDHSGRPLHHGRSTAAVDRPWRTVEITEVRT